MMVMFGQCNVGFYASFFMSVWIFTDLAQIHEFLDIFYIVFAFQYFSMSFGTLAEHISETLYDNEKGATRLT